MCFEDLPSLLFSSLSLDHWIFRDGRVNDWFTKIPGDFSSRPPQPPPQPVGLRHLCMSCLSLCPLLSKVLSRKQLPNKSSVGRCK